MPSIAHRIFWAGLATSFLCLTAPTIFRGFAGKFIGPAQPLRSSDAYLQVVTGFPNSSQRVIDLLAGLPGHKPILIVIRESDLGGSLLGMTMAYLAWPRDVQIVTISGPSCAEELAKVNPTSVAAVAFCEIMPPSWMPGGTPLGRNGRFVRLSSKVTTE